MDNSTRRFIGVARQFLSFNRKLKKELRRTLSDLNSALHKQTEAIRKSNQASDTKQSVTPEVTVLNNYPESIQVTQNAKDARDERNYKRFTFFVSALTVGAIVVYAVLVYWQYREMINSTGAAQQAVVEARLNRLQADKAFDATVEQFRLDQRPWIAIWQSRMVFDSQTPLGEQIEIVNVGKTPALHVTEAASRFIWPPPLLSGPTPKLINALRFSDAAPIPPQGKTSVSLGDADPKQQPLAADWISIKNGSQILYSFGEIRYEDTFGRKHSTKFCIHLANPGNANVLTYCNGYNDMN